MSYAINRLGGKTAVITGGGTGNRNANIFVIVGQVAERSSGRRDSA